MNAPKQYWLVGIGLIVLVQLLLAHGLTYYPNVLAVPPLRLSLIVISQLIVGIAIGFRLRVTNGAKQFYAALLILLFFFLLWVLYGPLRPSIAGRNVDQFELTVGMESLISFVVLAGFATINSVFFLKLAVARVKD